MGKTIRQIVFLLILLPLASYAQILDDSTKQVYGAKTVGFLLEQNYMLDDTNYLHPDTLIDGFRFMTINKQNRWIYQDLGNEGTAAKPIQYQTSDNLFTEVGIQSFSDLYAPKISQIKYYNTKSPYTLMGYTQSSNGLGHIDFTHSQNIKPNWNISFNVEKIASSKQYSAQTNEDRLVNHWDYTLNTNYTSKSKKYTALAALVHFNHLQKEQGGIQGLNGVYVTNENIQSGYNTVYQQKFQGVERSERWNDLHLFHQLNLAKGLQLFHIADYQRHKFFQKDTLINANFSQGLYALDSVNADKMKNYLFFENIQNRIGTKGVFKGFKYNVGLTNRIFHYTERHFLDEKNWQTEVIVGGDAGYFFADSTKYLNTTFYTGIGSNVSFLSNTIFHLKNMELGFKMLSKPAYLFQRSYHTVVDSWENSNFKNQNSTEAFAGLKLSGQKWWFRPNAKIQLLTNFSYFDQNQNPIQLDKVLFNTYLNTITGVKLGNWKLETDITFNQTSDKSVYRIPTIQNHSSIEYHFFYAQKLHMYLGTDFYFRSKYYADAYSPYVQGFHLQNDRLVGGVPIADIYANFMLNRVKLAFAFNFINQGIPYQGFYTTPDYLGMSRTFFIKVGWPLYD